jgi:hypothetical protein
MRALWRQLQTRLIVGALLFLLALMGAVVLVVRDSLLFSARNMAGLGAQGLLEQGEASLLEITRREAELNDQAVARDPGDLASLNQRLRDLRLTPNAYAFVVDAASRLVAISPGRAETLWGMGSTPGGGEGLGRSLLEAESAELRDLVVKMRSGQSAAARIDLGGEAVVVAYAPLA